MRLVRCATMPQPMSTPTAAGTIAPTVGITEPTVAPIPRCTSGIAATCECTKGRRATFASWRWAASSKCTPRVQARIGTPPGVPDLLVGRFGPVLSLLALAHHGSPRSRPESLPREYTAQKCRVTPGPGACATTPTR